MTQLLFETLLLYQNEKGMQLETLIGTLLQKSFQSWFGKSMLKSFQSWFEILFQFLRQFLSAMGNLIDLRKLLRMWKSMGILSQNLFERWMGREFLFLCGKLL